MASLTTAQLRRRLRDRIAELVGWTPAEVPYEVFTTSASRRGVPSTGAHQMFAVGTVELSADADRQKVGEGTLVGQDVRVGFLFRLSPEDQVQSQDSADDAAHAVVRQLMAFEATWPGDSFQLRFRAITSSLLPTGEWYLYDLRFQAWHRYALS